MFNELPDESGYTPNQIQEMIFDTSQANNSITFEQTNPSISSSINSLEAESIAKSPV